MKQGNKKSSGGGGLGEGDYENRGELGNDGESSENRGEKPSPNFDNIKITEKMLNFCSKSKKFNLSK